MKVHRLFLTAILIIISLMLIAANFLQPADPSNLDEVLQWLALGPGALFVAGAALAFLLELIPAWGSAIKASWRPWIVLGLTLALSFGAQALLAYPEAIQKITPVYTTIFLIVSAWLGTQLGYAKVKVSGMRAERLS